MRNWMRWYIAAAGFAATLAVLTSLAPNRPVLAEGVTLAEKIDAGMVRIGNCSRAAEITVTQWVDENFKSSNSVATTRQYTAHDWFVEVKNGRPSEIWRSYEAITGKERRTIIEGSDPIELDASDARANNTFMIALGGGKRELKGDVLATVDDKHKALALDDLAPSLLPGKSVSTGDSWNVPAENLSLPFGAGPGEVIKAAECTVTLAGVNDEDGKRVARLSLSATMTTYFEQINQFDDNASTRITSEWRISGEAACDAADGRLYSLKLVNKGSATGKLSGMNCSITGTSNETSDYHWGRVVNNGVENGKEGPDSVKDVYTAKHGKIADGHLVIARNNGEISRLQVFDPATGKIVRTLCALPKGVFIDDVALAPSRDKVAFISNGNSGISIADCNVFTVNTETGKLDQITPHWATGDGLAQPLSSAKKGSIKGRLVWYDDEFNRSRSDQMNISAVRVDQTNCFSSVDTNGYFELKDVPVGTSLFLYAWARLPNYTNGKWRHTLGNVAIASTVLMLTEEGAKDIGDLQIHCPNIDNGYMNPTFAGDSLWCNYTGVSKLYNITLGKRQWKEAEWSGSTLMSGALSASGNGKLLCMVCDGNIRFFEAAGGKEVWSTGVAASVGYNSSSAWLPGEEACVVSASVDGFLGTQRFGVPVLIYGNPGKKQLTFARKWPQFTGSEMKSVAMTSASSAYFVLHTPEPGKTTIYGDLFHYDSTTNTTRRVTSLGDVISVAGLGR